MKNKNSIINLILSIIIFGLVVIVMFPFFLLTVFLSNSTFQSLFSAGIFLCLLVVFGLILYNFLKKSKNNDSNNNLNRNMDDNTNIQKNSASLNLTPDIKNKRSSGVEGIIGDREFKMLDKNNDGRIMVSEFYPLTEQEVMEKIKKVDSKFSKIEFYSFVKEVILKLQNGWSNRDILGVRKFETDTLFKQQQLYIKDLIKSKKFERREKVTIKGVLLKDFVVDGNRELIDVAVTVNMKEYIEDEESSRILDGSKTKLVDVPYILSFVRKRGVNSEESLSLTKDSCPNCGASIDAKSVDVCSYCGSTIVALEYEWILVDIKKLHFGEFDPDNLWRI